MMSRAYKSEYNHFISFDLKAISVSFISFSIQERIFSRIITHFIDAVIINVTIVEVAGSFGRSSSENEMSDD